mmetsp:Transcript_105166/g.263406  ORF Transcript_105166/g.263406 Transcript_105166/m.263406 type:complete len:205 (+) Transcript_105166:480-1094(+)
MRKDVSILAADTEIEKWLQLLNRERIRAAVRDGTDDSLWVVATQLSYRGRGPFEEQLPRSLVAGCEPHLEDGLCSLVGRGLALVCMLTEHRSDAFLAQVRVGDSEGRLPLGFRKLAAFLADGPHLLRDDVCAGHTGRGLLQLGHHCSICPVNDWVLRPKCVVKVKGYEAEGHKDQAQGQVTDEDRTEHCQRQHCWMGTLPTGPA